MYSPRQRKAGACLITNNATKEYAAVSMAQPEAMVGVDALPGLAPKTRDSAMSLPKPKSLRGGKRKAPQEDGFKLRELSRGLLDAVERIFRK